MNQHLHCKLWILSLTAVAVLASLPFAAADEPFDYFRNNWNVIGLKDYDRGTRVTPENRLVLADGEVRLRFGEKRTPLSRRQTKTLLNGWMPVILIQAEEGPVHYEFSSGPRPCLP